MNIALQIVVDINRLKAKLKKKAIKKGLCKNFGQKEVRELEDKYKDLRPFLHPHHFGETESDRVWSLMSKFNDWCKNFDQSDLRGS